MKKSELCSCKESLQVNHYIFGAIMPGIILGLIPAIYALVYDSFGILLFGVFFTIVAAGDILMVYLLRNERMNSLVQDHPSEVGCYIYQNIITYLSVTNQFVYLCL